MLRLKTYFAALTLIGVLISMTTSGCSKAPQPPVAKKVPHVTDIHGHELEDDYYWLRERDNPEVMAYLESENAYTDAIMKDTKNLQDKLYKEMIGRIQETDTSAAIKDGDYFYYYREEAGKQYEIYCRKKGSLDAPEEVILDVNELAEGHDFLELGRFRISPDHNYLAYAIDTVGNEFYSIYIKDLNTGKLLPDLLLNTGRPLQWAANSRTLFYTTMDEINRNDKLWRHTIGQNPADDPMIFHETDLAYDIQIDKTKDRKYILLYAESNQETECYYLDAADPDGKFTLISPRKTEVSYYVDHRANSFYIMTNEDALNFKILRAPVRNTNKNSWIEVVPHDDSVLIESMDIFRDYLVLFERESGLKQIKVINLKNNISHFIAMPEPIYNIQERSYYMGTYNVDFESDVLRFSYQSLVRPETIYDYNLRTHRMDTVKVSNIPSGHNPDDYTSERIFATAEDDVKIPISLVYKKGLRDKGANPLVLYGYGSYGININPNFSRYRISLLERGIVFAIAHVRGSSTFGRWYYEDGRLHEKINTFTDFITCADYLVEQGYTTANQVVAEGGSAGGLLMGATANMRPDLFLAIIAEVPFVDLMNTMLDSTIPLTVNEYTEWGNPNVKEDFEYMLKYSPYDNVKAQDYPNMLIVTSLYDNRVQYWEPAKWTAKLRALKTDNNLLLLKINMAAGHAGASGRYDYVKEYAFQFAFIMKLLGIRK